MATPAEVLADSQCTVCSGTASLFESAAITILKQITGMTQDQINEASPCWICYGLSQSEAAILVLLNSIASGGSTLGCANAEGSGSPVGVVTPSCAGQFYSDTTGDVLWQARGLTNADWHQWI